MSIQRARPVHPGAFRFVPFAVCCLAFSTLGLVASRDLRVVDAAKRQDGQAVRAMLKERVDVNAPQADGATALHWAAHWDDLETAALLIRAGANVNGKNDLDVTALSLACENGSAPMVEALLAAGANPNIARATGETPLMMCARAGGVRAVKALLARGADVNAAERSRGQTSLMWAVATRRPEVVQALTEAGADVNARTVAGLKRIYSGPRYITAPPPPAEIARTVSMTQDGGYTPLLFAAQQGDVETASLLLGAGANVNDAPPLGTSPLVVAAHSGHGPLARLLLDRGADPNAAGAGYTALHAAVLRGDLELVDALLAHGADPNARLTRATQTRKSSTDFALSTSAVGATPFWLAAKFGEPAILRALSAKSANARLGLDDGTMPLHVAVMGALGNSDRRERYLSPVDLAARAPDEDERITLETVKTLATVGADLNSINQSGDTALHIAVNKGWNSVVQVLADLGADLSVKNKRGFTPLAIAMGAAARARPAYALETLSESERLKSTADLLRKLGATA